MILTILILLILLIILITVLIIVIRECNRISTKYVLDNEANFTTIKTYFNAMTKVNQERYNNIFNRLTYIDNPFKSPSLKDGHIEINNKLDIIKTKIDKGFKQHNKYPTKRNNNNQSKNK